MWLVLVTTVAKTVDDGTETTNARLKDNNNVIIIHSDLSRKGTDAHG